MADNALDLIPSGYRDERRARRLLTWTLPLFCAVVVGIGAARVTIDAKRAAVEQRVAIVRADITEMTAQRARVDALGVQRDALRRRVDLLDGLRGGPRVDRMFAVVDAAFHDQTWFRQWTFRRRGEIVDSRSATTQPGYFIIITPADGDKGDRQQSWRLETHMEIAGSALDHSALATFVERLLERTEVADVKILRTSSRQESIREVIDFDLAVTVDGTHEA